MKQFRVYYAGRPDDAVLLRAASHDEAAYLFFANQPREHSIIVEAGGPFGERSFSFEELKTRHSDAPTILESFDGQSGVIADTLEKDRKLQQAPKEDMAVVNAFVRRIVITIGVVMLFLAFLLQCKGN